MRIGIFSESYEPIVNGVSVCVSTLRDELVRRGHDVFIFASAFRNFDDGSHHVYRFPSRHTMLMPDYPFPIPCSPRIRREFESLKLDVVHTQTPFLLGMVGARWARRGGIPLVSTNHTLYTEYIHYAPIRPRALTRALLVGLMRRYYSGCDAVVAPSNPVADILRSYGVQTRIEIIKTGILPIPALSAARRETVRQHLGLGDGDIMLLYTGRIAREKNLSMLFRAFKLILASHPNVRLVLAGGGPALEETKAFALELGVSGEIVFTGMLSRSELEPVYASADIFVFPSTTETQGMAVSEAMSAGLPVVAVNAGGIPESIRREVDGFLTDDDPEVFAERVLYLIANAAERAAMGEQARENAQNLSAEQMATRFEELYCSVIKAPPSLGPRHSPPPARTRP